ncbi:hypothetical protein Ae706Ps2_4226 [Pseudonocardia sp. Ae706_Ps2]|nr:hypothetical protein Ae706Ps2_4226 [Pseudonocardia sp. Ae706_Ps2]
MTLIRESIAEMSGSRTRSATSRSAIAAASWSQSRGRVSGIVSSPSGVGWVTSTRNTRVMSAPAAISRPAMVRSQESSVAA